jgi:hypothetical protein
MVLQLGTQVQKLRTMYYNNLVDEKNTSVLPGYKDNIAEEGEKNIRGVV